MNIFKVLATLSVIFIGNIAMAYDVIVYGIAYNLDESLKTAEVTYRTKSKSDNNYSGDVVIPAAIMTNNKKYDVTSIGEVAFLACEKLKTVTIPHSIRDIHRAAFWMCEGEAIFVSEDNPYFSSLSGVLYNKDKTELLACLMNRKGELEIPATVTKIARGACYSAGKLTGIKFSPSVKHIDELAFSDCYNLTEIELPNNLEVIGDKAFSSCSKLIKVVFPNNNRLKSIGKEAFKYNYKLKEASISSGVVSIGEEAFYSCKSIGKVVIPESVTTIGEKAFDFDSDALPCNFYVGWNFAPEMGSIFSYKALRGTLYVPYGTRSSYLQSYPWMNFSEIKEYDYSSVSSVQMETVTVNVRGNNLLIDNLPAGCIVDVYDLTGANIYHGYDSMVEVNLSGFLIVKIGCRSWKVIM